ncbi:MAG: hypothetical protein K0S93_70 [Nitrososphaeraceae archaeon]|jgi:hypothetical protein|nr:hypothetical protein [Nitrososphaeraceae archaeon]
MNNLNRYKQYEKNLSHNIKHERKLKQEYENNPYYDETKKEKIITEYNKSIYGMENQLVIIREIIFDLQDKRDYYFHTSINFRLGEV